MFNEYNKVINQWIVSGEQISRNSSAILTPADQQNFCIIYQTYRTINGIPVHNFFVKTHGGWYDITEQEAEAILKAETDQFKANLSK